MSKDLFFLTFSKQYNTKWLYPSRDTSLVIWSQVDNSVHQFTPGVIKHAPICVSSDHLWPNVTSPISKPQIRRPYKREIKNRMQSSLNLKKQCASFQSQHWKSIKCWKWHILLFHQKKWALRAFGSKQSKKLEFGATTGWKRKQNLKGNSWRNRSVTQFGIKEKKIS